jgi:erythromycin esterase-like protein
VLHEATEEDKIITLNKAFQARREQRTVGVVYQPESERGNYVLSILAEQYDYLVFIHASDALHALPIGREAGQAPAPVASAV